jgi:hypothetical protein
LVLLAARSEAASITIAWNPNSEHDIAGYTVSWGTQSRVYTSSRDVAAGVTSLVISNLQSGVTYYFAVQAFNTAGLKSIFSAEVGALIGGGSPPPPMVTAVLPASGSTAGGTPVTITGANFTTGATVTFGSVAAANAVVASGTSMTATTPAHAAGVVSVTVTNPDGQSIALPNAFTYQATTVTFTRAGLTTPTPGSTLTGSGATFEWTAGTGVSQVVLYVGTEGPGSYDLYCASLGTTLSAPVSGLPVDGRTIYVRLWSSYIGGGWQYDDYGYTAATGWARLQAPTPGSTLTSSSVTFGWTEGGELSQIALYVGTGGAGSFDLYAAYQGTSLSATVSAVPTDGRMIYVRLWSYLGGRWQYEDSTYQASTGSTDGVQLTTPAPGSTFASTSVTFGWTAGSGVSRVALYVGTGGVGSYDLHAGLQGPGLSASVSGLPGDGRTIYVRLWSYVGLGWQYNDYIYKATTGRAQLIIPTPRSMLTSSSVTFGWTVGSGVSAVALYVGIGGVGSYDLYSAHQDTSGSATISGLPANGETIYVRLWSNVVGQGWQYGDYTYTAKK